ncbi:MAG: hypothetical protein RQ741_01115 [Wenzhouxiangellaceae bacterium]|nr:hypothetical protein [Wenzhouxiangellaceae bacterium]
MKTPTGIFLLQLLTLALLSPNARADLAWRLEAAQITVAGFSVDRLEAGSGDQSLKLAGIEHPMVGPVGTLVVACRRDDRAPCDNGELEWQRPEGDPLGGEFSRLADGIRLQLGPSHWSYRWGTEGRQQLEATEIPLDWLGPKLIGQSGLVDLDGTLAVTFELTEAEMNIHLDIEALAFDTRDGRFAGGGLSLGLDARLHDWGSRPSLTADLEWRGGEALLGPVYLPPPEQSWRVRMVAARLGQSWVVDEWSIAAGQGMRLHGDARLAFDTGMPAIERAGLNIERLELGPLWRHGLQSLAASFGFGELEPGGLLSGSISLEPETGLAMNLMLSDVSISDERDRIRIDGLRGRIDWRDAGSSELVLGDLVPRDPQLRVSLAWDDAGLLQIPLGASGLELASRKDGALTLVEPWSLPILDGRLVVEHFEWRDWLSENRDLRLDAYLEPVELSALTHALGWVEFGGRVAGQFNGLRLAGGTLALDGGLQVDLFSGQARVEDLSVERFFGSLPALSANIELERLNLEQLTSTFEFGHMQGLVSGHIHDLRLLDWQPVAFDAWFETLKDSDNRRISQRAINSLSSIGGGGGGAALSGTLLSWFDDFPYQKVALGCRLSNNVCRMRGIEKTESGGYLIVKGRSIPHLDVIGYQQRVDWPRLVAQLQAISESSPVVGTPDAP